MTTLVLDAGEAVRADAARVLIVTPMAFQGHELQQHLDKLGWPAALADGAEAGRISFMNHHYDLVVLDVDLGYPTVEALVDGLLTLQPNARVAMMLGWWDNRLQDMRSWGDLLIFKPAHLDQVRQVINHVSAFPAGPARA